MKQVIRLTFFDVALFQLVTSRWFFSTWFFMFHWLCFTKAWAMAVLLKQFTTRDWNCNKCDYKQN